MNLRTRDVPYYDRESALPSLHLSRTRSPYYSIVDNLGEPLSFSLERADEQDEQDEDTEDAALCVIDTILTLDRSVTPWYTSMIGENSELGYSLLTALLSRYSRSDLR